MAKKKAVLTGTATLNKHPANSYLLIGINRVFEQIV
jgi:hypothetical protein